MPVRAIILTYSYGTSKVLAIKKPSFTSLVPSCICEHYHFYAFCECDLGEGVPSSTGAPGVLGIWGIWLFIFRDLGSTGNYFRGAGEQAQSFGDLGSPAKKQ